MTEIFYRHSRVPLAGEVVHGRTVYEPNDGIQGFMFLLDPRLERSGMTCV
jgi:hypothetical protein